MPNRRTHVDAGAIAGLAAALILSHSQSPALVFVEVAGGLLGGVLGGVAPDFIEPATSPSHRKFAHSVVTAGSLSLANVAAWQTACRRHAAEFNRLVSELAVGSRERSDAELAAVWWSFLAGCIAGFVAGYASHLVLDAATPRGLPFVGA